MELFIKFYCNTRIALYLRVPTQGKIENLGRGVIPHNFSFPTNSSIEQQNKSDKIQRLVMLGSFFSNSHALIALCEMPVIAESLTWFNPFSFINNFKFSAKIILTILDIIAPRCYNKTK